MKITTQIRTNLKVGLSDKDKIELKNLLMDIYYVSYCDECRREIKKQKGKMIVKLESINQEIFSFIENQMFEACNHVMMQKK